MPVDALTTWHMLISSGPSCGTRAVESRTEKWIGDRQPNQLIDPGPLVLPVLRFGFFGDPGWFVVRSHERLPLTKAFRIFPAKKSRPAAHSEGLRPCLLGWNSEPSWPPRSLDSCPSCGQALEGSNTVMFSPCYLEASKCNKFSGNTRHVRRHLAGFRTFVWGGPNAICCVL